MAKTFSRFGPKKAKPKAKPVAVEPVPFDPHAEARKAIADQAKTVLRDGCVGLIERLYLGFEENKEEIQKTLQPDETMAHRFATCAHSALAKEVYIPGP